MALLTRATSSTAPSPSPAAQPITRTMPKAFFCLLAFAAALSSPSRQLISTPMEFRTKTPSWIRISPWSSITPLPQTCLSLSRNQPQSRRRVAHQPMAPRIPAKHSLWVSTCKTSVRRTLPISRRLSSRAKASWVRAALKTTASLSLAVLPSLAISVSPSAPLAVTSSCPPSSFTMALSISAPSLYRSSWVRLPTSTARTSMVSLRPRSPAAGPLQAVVLKPIGLPPAPSAILRLTPLSPPTLQPPASTNSSRPLFQFPLLLPNSLSATATAWNPATTAACSKSKSALLISLTSSPPAAASSSAATIILSAAVPAIPSAGARLGPAIPAAISPPSSISLSPPSASSFNSNGVAARTSPSPVAAGTSTPSPSAGMAVAVCSRRLSHFSAPLLLTALRLSRSPSPIAPPAASPIAIGISAMVFPPIPPPPISFLPTTPSAPTPSPLPSAVRSAPIPPPAPITSPSLRPLFCSSPMASLLLSKAVPTTQSIPAKPLLPTSASAMQAPLSPSLRPLFCSSPMASLLLSKAVPTTQSIPAKPLLPTS